MKRNLWPFGDSTRTTTVYHRRGASFTKGANYKGYRVWEDENGWHTSLDPGSWFDSKRDVTRFIDSWVNAKNNGGFYQAIDIPALRGFHPNPPKGWFERCVKAVKAKGGAYDPNAVCAVEERRLGKRNILPIPVSSIGTASSAPGLIGSSEKWLQRHGVMKKNARRQMYRGFELRYSRASREWGAWDDRGNHYGPFSNLRDLKRKIDALTGEHSRGNPEAEAASSFEKFHGYPPDQQVVVDKDVHYHSQLWAVGDLEKLIVVSADGDEVDLTGFKGAVLSANENNTQLYIEGGDQSTDLEVFGIGQPYHDKEDLGEIRKIFYFTNKTHLGDQGGEAIYHHKFGEEKKHRSYEFGKLEGRRVPRPRLVYDVLNNALEIVGGEYVIEPEGIRN